VGKEESYKPGIPLLSNTHIALELNADKGTLDFFIEGKQIPHRVKDIPKDVYFGVCYLFYFIYT
jgi:hypothetical protein